MDARRLRAQTAVDYRGHSVNYRRLPFGYIPGYAPWSVDRHDSDTVIRGLTKRLGRDLPPTNAKTLNDLSAFVAEFCKTNFRPVQVLSFEEWLETTNYSEGRKGELRREYERYFGSQPPRRSCQHVDSFIKLESYEEPKEARWINSRSDAFKAFAGGFFKAMEQEVYKNPWFVKHIPVPDRPGVIRALHKAGYHVYENDYKAFESHMTVEIMEACELQLYRYLLSACPKDAEFICSVISGTNKLHTKLGIRFDVEARRMSGDLCTSLGNGFTNLMVVLFIASRKNADISGLVEGDDGLFVIDKELTKEDFAEVGFTVEIHEVRYPWEAHFCGMTCSEDGTLLKDPRRVFRTFGWTNSFIHAGNGIMCSLLRSKALSLCYELPQCPIVGQLARTALVLTEGVVATADTEWNARPVDYIGPTGPFQPTPEARVQMERAFGVSVDVQVKAEELIREHRLDLLAELIPAPADIAFYDAAYVEVR